MFAVYADSFSSDDPLSGLVAGRASRPGRRGRAGPRSTSRPPRSTTTTCGRCAASGCKQEALPMILGCDAAGLDEDGNEVVVHAVVSDPSWRGDETLDPRRSLLSRALPGHARRQGRRARAATWCPSRPRCRFEEAACLPTAWLTAYRMLFTQGGLKPGDSVLVQGAGGGVATALIALGRAGGPAGLRDQPRRGQARAGARARRPRGVRERRPAARARSTPSWRPSARRPGRTR